MTTKERSVEEITLQFAGLLDSLKARIYQAQTRNEPGVDSAMIKVINVFEATLQDERQKREKQGKRYITLINQALGETELPESVWKKIARVNQLILDK